MPAPGGRPAAPAPDVVAGTHRPAEGRPARGATHRRWWMLAAVSLTQVLIVLDGTVVTIALPQAQTDLGLGDGARQWVVTAYALTFGALLLLGGRIADYWGRRRTYLLGLVLFGVGSCWGGLADQASGLLAARALQGAAAALMAPSALAFVTVGFTVARERDRAFAVFGSLGGLGSAAGMLVGGVLTELLSWRWCLLVNVPLVVVGLVAGVLLLDEGRAEGEARYDVPGAVTATLGVGLVVLGLTWAEVSWVAPRTWGTVLAGLLALGGFVLVERRHRHPLLPLHVLTDRTRATAFTVQALLGAAGVGAMVHVTYQLQLVLGFGPLPAGLATLPFTVSLMAMVPWSVRLVGRFGPRRQMMAGPMVSCAGLLVLAAGAVAASTTATGDPAGDGGTLVAYCWQVLPGLVLMGAGMGLTVVPINNLALHGVGVGDAGVASATVTAANQLGGSVGLALLTAVYVAAAVPGAGDAHSTSTGAMAAGDAAVFVGCAVVYAAMAVLALVGLRRGAGRPA